MKFAIPLLFLFIPFSSAKAQAIDTARMIIRYKMEYVPDSSTHERYDVKHPFMLLIGQRSSFFVHLYNFERDSSALNPNPNGRTTLRGLLGAYFQPEIYTDIINKKQTINENLIGRNYLSVNTLPDLQWRLKEESKQIQGYTCFKAIGQWRGREWTAWYCPELPYNYGPWKLSGLPGLILAANDSEHEYSFTAIHIKSGMNYYHPIALPAFYEKLNEKDLYRILKVYHADPSGFVKANPLANDVGSQIQSSTLTRDPNYVTPKSELHRNNNSPEKNHP